MEMQAEQADDVAHVQRIKNHLEYSERVLAVKMRAYVKERNEAGLDEGFLSLTLFNLLYMENPHSYKKFQ